MLVDFPTDAVSPRFEIPVECKFFMMDLSKDLATPRAQFMIHFVSTQFGNGKFFGEACAVRMRIAVENEGQYPGYSKGV